jgi:hypothetical protein
MHSSCVLCVVSFRVTGSIPRSELLLTLNCQKCFIGKETCQDETKTKVRGEIRNRY